MGAPERSWADHAAEHRHRALVACIPMILARSLLLVLVTVAVGAMWASPAVADLPAGSFVFDGTVASVTHDPLGGATYIGGRFAKEQAPTGSGIEVSTSGTGTPNSADFPHVVGDVSAAIGDGAGGWYIAGRFTSVGGAAISRLAHLNANGTVDTGWHPNPSDSSSSSSPVSALVLSGSTLYVAGRFTSIGGQPRNRIAALNATTGQATSWDPNANGSVSVLAISGSTVYAGGNFTSIGGQARNELAALDTSSGDATSWDPNPQGVVFGASGIATITMSGPIVYVSGWFTSIGGQSRGGVAALDASTGSATSWDPNVGVYSGSGVYSVLVSGSTIYLGGNFTSVGGQSRANLAAVDATTAAPTSWTAHVGSTGHTAVNSMVLSGVTLYIGGHFNLVASTSRSNAAAVDTVTGDVTDWDPNPSNDVVRMALSGSTIYLGGAFISAGPLLAQIKGLARLNADGSLDTDFSPNPNDQPAAITVSGATVYVAGVFTLIDGQSRNGLAALDATTGVASSWNPSPSGPFNNYSSIVVTGPTVYVSGLFDAVIGGQHRAGIVALDATTGQATSWDAGMTGTSQLGNPVGVTKMILSGSAIYVGGYFTSIGGQSRSNLAALDLSTAAATSWNPGTNNRVDAMVLSGSTLYIAGQFTSVGAQAREGLASVDTSTGAPTAFNPGTNAGASISSMAFSGSTLFVAGVNLTSLGGQPRTNLAAVDVLSGMTDPWDPQPNEAVNGVAASGSTVYAGGDQTVVGGQITGPLAILDFTIAPTSDTQAPSITIGAPTEGEHVRLGATVSSVFSCDDGAGSGIATCTGPATLDTAAAGAHTFTVDATDNAGNPATKDVHYVVDPPADATPPAITVTTPTEGQHVAQGATIATVYSCDDATGSGVATCSAPATLDTAVAGPHTFTVNAADKSDNAASKEVHYVVDLPVNGPGVTSTQIKQALLGIRATKPLTRKSVIKAGKAVFIFTAPSGGAFSVTWTAKRSGKTVVIAKGGKVLAAAGHVKVPVKLTSAGRKLLKRARKPLKVSAALSFSLPGGPSAKRTTTLTLR